LVLRFFNITRSISREYSKNS